MMLRTYGILRITAEGTIPKASAKGTRAASSTARRPGHRARAVGRRTTRAPEHEQQIERGCDDALINRILPIEDVVEESQKLRQRQRIGLRRIIIAREGMVESREKRHPERGCDQHEDATRCRSQPEEARPASAGIRQQAQPSQTGEIQAGDERVGLLDRAARQHEPVGREQCSQPAQLAARRVRLHKPCPGPENPWA